MDIVIEENVYENLGPKIKVIGVGGGGGNMISHTIKNGTANSDMDQKCQNPDVQPLRSSLQPIKISLGPKDGKANRWNSRPKSPPVLPSLA